MTNQNPPPPDAGMEPDTNKMTRLEHGCITCDATGHTAQGVWDCPQCLGTGVGDTEVREACRTIIAAARQIDLIDVSEANVHAFWRRMVEHHAREATNGFR